VAAVKRQLVGTDAGVATHVEIARERTELGG
jgi:hypothetical protein